MKTHVQFLRKVTSITLVLAMQLSLLSPWTNAFAQLGGSDFTATQTTANVSADPTQSATTVTTQSNVAGVSEVKASRTLTVGSIPADNETITIGSCVVTFKNIASEELNCADNVATVKRASANGNTVQTRPQVANSLRSLLNVSATGHGTLNIPAGS